MPGRDGYDAFIAVVTDRIMIREFAPDAVIPREHYELIVEAARHSPSPGNTQAWHFVIVTDPEAKQRIADVYLAERTRRVQTGLHIPDAGYAGIARAPGVIAVVGDLRFVRAFPVPPGEDPGPYRANQERMIVQSIATATMAAHLAISALAYNGWWVTASGLRNVPEAINPLLDVPDGLTVMDLVCFGPPATPPHKRWKRELDEIVSWERFDRAKLLSDDVVEGWIRNLPADEFLKSGPLDRPGS